MQTRAGLQDTMQRVAKGERGIDNYGEDNLVWQGIHFSTSPEPTSLAWAQTCEARDWRTVVGFHHPLEQKFTCVSSTLGLVYDLSNVRCNTLSAHSNINLLPKMDMSANGYLQVPTIVRQSPYLPTILATLLKTSLGYVR